MITRLDKNLNLSSQSRLVITLNFWILSTPVCCTTSLVSATGYLFEYWSNDFLFFPPSQDKGLGYAEGVISTCSLNLFPWPEKRMLVIFSAVTRYAAVLWGNKQQPPPRSPQTSQGVGGRGIGTVNSTSFKQPSINTVVTCDTGDLSTTHTTYSFQITVLFFS